LEETGGGGREKRGEGRGERGGSWHHELIRRWVRRERRERERGGRGDRGGGRDREEGRR
jgi:hypothetical protein